MAKKPSAALAGAIKRGDRVLVQRLQHKMRELRYAVGNMEAVRAKLVSENDDLRAENGRLRKQMAVSCMAAKAFGEETTKLRAELAKLDNAIHILTKENERLREQVAHSWRVGPVVHRSQPWTGDTGVADLVDLECKLDALLGADATKVLRTYVNHLRRFI